MKAIKDCLSIRNCITVTIHLICLAVLLLFVAYGIKRHFKFETRALITVKPTSEAKDFAAFTICPLFDNSYKEEVLRKYGLTPLEYKNGNFTGNSTNVNLWEIYNQITFSIDELLSELRVSVIGDGKKGLDSGSTIYFLCSKSDECPSDYPLSNGSGKHLEPNSREWNEGGKFLGRIVHV